MTAALSVIVEANNWYVASNFMEGAMHELTHAVLIGHGVARRNFEDAIVAMKYGWSNRHEIAVMAMQLAAFRVLGVHQGIWSAAYAVAAAVHTTNTRITRYDTISGCRREILATKPNPKYVAAIVRYVRFMLIRLSPKE